MSSQGIAEDFKAKLQEKIKSYTQDLTSGKALNFEEYKGKVASIKAYQDAENIFNETVRRYLREES
jgi:hypothetical protein